VTDLVKTFRTAPVALLALALALVMVGSSCSSVDPVALQVGDWQLSNKDFQDQLTQYDTAFKAITSADDSLKGPNGQDWATIYTARLLNYHLTFHLAQLAVANRGIEVTDDDRAKARTSLEQTFTDQSGTGHFSDLSDAFQQDFIEGAAAQNLLAAALVAEKTTVEALREAYDNDPSLFAQACVSHILVYAGGAQNGETATDADLAAARTKIEGIQAQLKGTSNFAAVATASSEDTGSAADGGSLGCKAKGSYPEQFDAAVWSQPVGEVGPIVEAPYGYHLILVTSRDTPSFDDAKSTIAGAVQQSASSLVQAELVKTAVGVDISVDGRYGQYDVDTAQIISPAGADQPSTPDTTDLLGSSAQ
jgi:parvulin-like peptidyl-prolyl isomerase